MPRSSGPGPLDRGAQRRQKAPAQAMADKSLFNPDAEDRWRLAYDSNQWVLQKRAGSPGRNRYGIRESGFKDGELTVAFNDEAGFVEGTQKSGDDDERALNCKTHAEETLPGHRTRRGKSYGYRRNSD